MLRSEKRKDMRSDWNGNDQRGHGFLALISVHAISTLILLNSVPSSYMLDSLRLYGVSVAYVITKA